MTRFPTLVLAVLVVSAVAVPAAGQAGKNKDVLNPNLATDKELLPLPHMTEEIVKLIMEQRPFLKMEDFDKALNDTLTREQRTELYVKLFVPINLNKATNEELLLVPGAGRRMAHEFEEYRPYKALAQFRREIGKYVDDAEVARLEQYVFVPIDLNSASDEDILSIPGVGRRMLREFREYRPYTNIEQFRREIGKYVEEKEVARLERYVFIATEE